MQIKLQPPVPKGESLDTALETFKDFVRERNEEEAKYLIHKMLNK